MYHEKAGELLRDVFLHYLHANKSSMDYRPKANTYRISSAHACENATIISSLLDTLSDEQRELIERNENAINIDKKRLGVAQAGTGLHERIQSMLKDWIYYIADEGTVSFKPENEEFQFVGHYDLLMLNPYRDIEGKGSELLVIDIKSANSQFWDNWAWIHKPEYLDQLILYQHVLGKIDGALMYVGRNGYEIEMLYQEYSEDRYKRVIEKFRYIHEYVRKEEIPEPPHPKDRYPCKKVNRFNKVTYKCKYFEICHSFT